MARTIDIVFDGPPGPEAGRFVEVEDETGASMSLGEWVERDDGFWALRIPDYAELLGIYNELTAAINDLPDRASEGHGHAD